MDFVIGAHRTRPGDDPIFSLNAEAQRRQAAGEDVINATIGALLDDDGKLALMPSVVEALRDVEPEVAAGYAPIPGRSDFRHAVVQDLLGPVGLADRAVCVATPGGSGALRISMDNFLEPHQTVLTSSYFWGPYRTQADEAGRAFTTFTMFDPNGRFHVADLERKLEGIASAQGRALLVLNTPCHNPTGYSLDDDEWRATVDILDRIAQRTPVGVLLDAAYAYFAPEGVSRALTHLTRIVNRALVLIAWSASKSFAHYGLRVGALVAVVPDQKERTITENALTYSCRGLWSNCNAGGMAAIARVLTEAGPRQRAQAERATLVALLARRVARWNELAPAAGLTYPRYDGGFFTTVFCDDAPAVATRLKARGVFVVAQPGLLRVAICALNEPQIERTVAAIADEVRPRAAVALPGG
jgi:aromatic-amino-acid transaminase